MTRAYRRDVDVTGVTHLGGPMHTAVTVFVPDEIPQPATVLFAFPGAGYGRAYYDIQRRPGYSQAAFHTDQGFVFVACDHIGVGESSQPDTFEVSYEDVAAINHATVGHILRDLQAGLDPLCGPMEIGASIGIAQSMGGCFLTVQQANHATFDGVALLGWSNVRVTFPGADGSRILLDGPERGCDLRTALTGENSNDVPTPEESAFCFHWEDEDEELAGPDMASYLPSSGMVRGDPSTPWGSALIPACSVTMARSGTVAAEAGSISVPVLLAFGARDVSADPWIEPAAYRSCRDVRLSVVPRMAHMHNFARTRADLWARIADFAGHVERR